MIKLALFTILLNHKLPLHIANLLVKKKMMVNLFVHLLVHLMEIFLLLMTLIILSN